RTPGCRRPSGREEWRQAHSVPAQVEIAGSWPVIPDLPVSTACHVNRSKRPIGGDAANVFALGHIVGDLTLRAEYDSAAIADPCGRLVGYQSPHQHPFDDFEQGAASKDRQ